MNQTIHCTKSTDPFARILKSLLDDPKLPWKAKGIASYLLGKKDGWKIQVSDLVNRGSDGKAAIRAGLKELRDAGYANLTVIRSAGKIVSWHWEIADKPIFSPDTDFQEVENQEVENRHLSKNDRTKNQETKNRGLKESPQSGDTVVAAKRRFVPPTKQQFDAFLESDERVSLLRHYRDPDAMFARLGADGWCIPKNGGMKPVKDWKKLLIGLAGTIDTARTGRR